MNFWLKFKKPIIILAPMEGVTDTVFRQIVAGVGRPDVFFTEFVPVDAITSKAQEKVVEKFLRYSKAERPLVAQIWGIDPEKFYESARLLKKLGFDGIDINMGCPVDHVIKKGSCSALIKTPKLALEIINATIKGAGDLPVSVKTRIGFSKIEMDWVRMLLQTKITALTLHLRTAKEKSKVPAHWEEMERVVAIREELKSRVLIIGNGDVKSLKEAQNKCKKYKIDGIMIGRGIFDNVWLFNPQVDIKKVTPKQKIDLLIKHLELFQKTWGKNRHFALMKKFVKCYISNYDGATEDREILMQTKNLDELTGIAARLLYTT
ncbi:MAG: tRNA-dihydrouridine synthase [Candidatus Daviesbacteria bacterium]|nr:tRNA-dihydrouridine synthase [Candidatus Daviesbacteria bacterium]